MRFAASLSASRRCPHNVDSNPQDTTSAACLTDDQISTLNVVYSRYKYATPLANGSKPFGMWVPNTDPSGSGLILNDRFIGQEGAVPPMRECIRISECWVSRDS